MMSVRTKGIPVISKMFFPPNIIIQYNSVTIRIFIGVKGLVLNSRYYRFVFYMVAGLCHQSFQCKSLLNKLWYIIRRGDESGLDPLINGTRSRKIATYLQALK